jgi:uncharacterized membrane protein YkoI
MAREFLLWLACALLATSSALGAEATEKPAEKPVCLSQTETREEIADHRLMAPFVVLKTAAGIAKAEALSAKLCRSGEEYVYEIALLDRHGRLMHLVMNAATGKIVTSRNMRESPPRT